MPGYVDAYWQASERLGRPLAESLAMAWEDRKNYEAMSATAIEGVVGHFNAEQAQSGLTPL